MTRTRAASERSSSVSSKSAGEESVRRTSSAFSTEEQELLRVAGPAVGLGADRGPRDVPSIQTKLTVRKPGDRYEKEAERIADEVMRMPDEESKSPKENLPEDRIQRLCPRCRRRHRQGKPLNCKECEQELQLSAGENSFPATEDIKQAVAVANESGEPLSESVKLFFGNRLGRDFTDVRIHTGVKANQAAQSIDARAYTLGSDVVFGSGEYRPDTREGKRLLAHELTHTVQQDMNSSKADNLVQRQATESEEVPAGDIAGTTCACSDESKYSEGTIAFIWAVGNSVKRFASQYEVSAPAVAGAIADEYETQDMIDAFQEYFYQARGETRLETEQSLDIKTGYGKADKLLNVLENDIGPGNIKIRTALKIKRAEIAREKGKKPEDVNVSLTDLIDELMTPSGTAKYAAAYIAEAKAKFSGHENFKIYPPPAAETIYVSYYKQGENYYTEWAKNPSDPPCPGSGGCRFYANRDRIVEALSTSPRILENE